MRHAIIPIRDFSGMTRLAPAFDASERTTLSAALAHRVLAAARDSALGVTVVTADDDVTLWAFDQGVTVMADPGGGLSTAATHAIDSIDGEPWVLIHADLPSVDAGAIGRVCLAADRVGASIAPSLDGGTNAIAATGAFRFSFGQGSFHRHLAHRPDAAVVVDRRLALEVDTPSHARALGTLGLLPSLTP